MTTNVCWKRSMIGFCLLYALTTASASAAPASAFGKTVRDQVGVNIHFTDQEPGEVDEIANAGFGVVRTDFVWANTEKKAGVYDFSDYDRLLSALESDNIRPLWILDYGNPLYDQGGRPVSDEARAAFTAWATAAVKHFAGHRILWEMWNEPNSADWTSDYIRLAIAVGQAIHAVRPREIYIGPAESGDDPAYLESLFKGGVLTFWDAVSVHPYRTTNPETSQPELTSVQALITKYEPYGANIPVISGEWGYSVMPTGGTYSFVTSDAEQAQYFDREILSNMAMGLPLSVWYDWRNDRDKINDTESNFGLVQNAYVAGQIPPFNPKPSYLAAKAFLSTLGDYVYNGQTPVSGSTGSLLIDFRLGRDHRYVAYTTSLTPETVLLPVPRGKYQVLDISGNKEKDVVVTREGLPLSLTGDVQFLVRR